MVPQKTEHTAGPVGPAFRSTDSRSISTLVSAKGDPAEIIGGELGPRFWDYRRRWDLARTYRIEPEFPIQVDYEPFYGCNLRCPICVMSLPAEERRKYGDPGQRLDLDMIRGLLKEGAANGQAAVGLNGICEPLLDPHLVEMVRLAREAGMVDVMFNTNGLALTPDLSRELIQAGLTRIMISLDAATPETYRRIRVGSDYQQVVENVRRFAEIRTRLGRKLPVLRMSFCVTSLNEHERDAFIDQWTPVVDFFSIQQYGNTFEGEYARDRSRLFSPKNPYRPEPGLRCAQPNKRAMVRHNGDVIPCCDASGLHLVIGNIHQASLSEIWQGARARELRSLHRQGRWADDPICRACQAKWRPDENIGEPGGRA